MRVRTALQLLDVAAALDQERDALDAARFWTKRGFVRRPDIVTRFAWRDVETNKPMVFWVKDLA